jgi:hypothetical protein
MISEMVVSETVHDAPAHHDDVAAHPAQLAWRQPERVDGRDDEVGPRPYLHASEIGQPRCAC